MSGKDFLFIAVGMFLMYVVLKIAKSKTVQKPNASNAALRELAMTGEAMNLVRTNEFRELAKTTEFRAVVNSLAKEQINIITSALVS
jgi:hypothetical protein